MPKIADSVHQLRARQAKRARRKGDLAPNPQLWSALENGKLLSRILEDFYSQVFEDKRLAGFFVDSTRQRAAEKQYLFMKRIVTGENCYFGERPRNAHHWMVISDDLFDYREDLLEQTMIRHGLAPEYIRQWLAIDEVFRKQIVKDQPFGKKIGGIVQPVEGYQTEKLAVGSLCDQCQIELPPGTFATYHLRTGKTYCEQCAADLDKDAERA